MSSFVAEDDSEECRFFDASEDTVSLASVSDSGSECSESFETYSKNNNWVSSEFPYDMWIRSPGSVQERRNKFISWLGLSSDRSTSENFVDVCSDVLEGEVDRRITASSGAVLMTSGFVQLDSWQSNDALALSVESDLRDNFVCRTGNLVGGRESNATELEQEFRVSGSDRPLLEEFENLSGSSPLLQELLQSKTEEARNQVGTTKRVKKGGWLNKLRSLACRLDRKEDSNLVQGGRAQRVRVHRSNKKLKELSALYKGQDIKAHEGSILAMKFSPDGQYLASAGEDGIVRVWQVVEENRSNEFVIPDIDPSCIYFTVNHLSELAPLFVEREKMGKLKTVRRTSNSACVIFPPKLFRILEKPVHEFHGHNDKILDLTWSKNNYLLSASVDATVRLWRVGCDHCLKVFIHSNYVSCVQFNPVDEDFFVSGSIDGKVRIWAIPSCQVVDWIDMKDIVSAVCYRPDAQGVIVGSMTGSCRFYNVSDNHLLLDAQICLRIKKKSPCKRITGLQFLPQDPSKVMVTCAGSQVRILDGVNVIGKYRGPSAGNHLNASFTSDGKHIVSSCDDSNVYVWNCISSEERAISQAKNIRSCERFSANASVAIPWCGIKNGKPGSRWQVCVLNDKSHNTLPFSSPACFSLTQEFFLEFFAKASATWPEERLPTSSPLAISSGVHRSQYKFLKSSCQSSSSSHAWGMVIVTAGWDGRIKSFHNYGLPIPD